MQPSTHTSTGTNKWGGTYRVRYGHFAPEELPDVEWFGNPYGLPNQKRYKFYTRLEASVRSGGFRNPVCWHDPGHTSNNGNKPYSYGGSRCYTAAVLKIPLPVIVCDQNHNPRYDEWHPIEGVADALACFKDLPSIIEFGRDNFFFWGCEQTHIDEGREFFDNMQNKNDAHHKEMQTKRLQHSYEVAELYERDAVAG